MFFSDFKQRFHNTMIKSILQLLEQLTASFSKISQWLL